MLSILVIGAFKFIKGSVKGLTIIPIRLYIKGHHAKVEIALAKGRHRYDKRRVIMQRETDREIARSIRHRTY